MMIISLGTIIGHGLDFPYSPIRLIILTLPLNVSDEIVDAVWVVCGFSLCHFDRDCYWVFSFHPTNAVARFFWVV
jgi:hypothetical protein